MLAASLTLVDLTGETASLASMNELRGFFLETAFGPVWLARIAFSAAAFAVALRFAIPSVLPKWRHRQQDTLLLVLSAGILIGLAAAGHARSALADGSQDFAVCSEAIHLLAAGAWTGGLPPLLFYLARVARQDQETGLDQAAFRRNRLNAENLINNNNLERASVSVETQHALALPVLQRFSFVGQWSVVLLLAGGLSTLAALLAAWNVKASGLQLSGYSIVLSVKLALLAIMLAIAIVNRFILMRQLERRRAGVFLLQRMVLIECVLGVLIIAAATVLGSQAPPAA